MRSEPIKFVNRETGGIEEEAIYGERWLRWTYETGPGRFLLNLLIRRPFFSRYYGWMMDKPSSRGRIGPFIEQYGIDPAEFADDPETFGSFNEFFFRKLKPEARPIVSGSGVACFPADGRHLGYQSLSECENFIVKGQRFDLAGFLGDPGLAERFAGGSLVISRLCPVDYHRYHFPCDGIPGESRLINGWLYSVSPIALRRNVSYLVENKRSYSLIESPEFGTVLFAEIGATCVGGMVDTFVPGRPVLKGDEKGYFRFGGSCTILIFEKGRIQLDSDLLENSSRGLETYARMGERCGSSGKAEN